MEAVDDADAELGRAALDSARAASRRAPLRPGAPAASPAGAGRTPRSARGGYSGAGPDPRDPQPFGALVRRLVADRGWEATAASATVLAGWDRIVGAELAARCQPVSLRGGELTLAAESTAWAMQLRGMLPTLMTRIRAELGPGRRDPDPGATARPRRPGAPAPAGSPAAARATRTADVRSARPDAYLSRGVRDTYSCSGLVPAQQAGFCRSGGCREPRSDRPRSRAARRE